MLPTVIRKQCFFSFTEVKFILLAISAGLLGCYLFNKNIFIKEEIPLIFDLSGKPVSFTKNKENNGKKKIDDDR